MLHSKVTQQLARARFASRPVSRDKHQRHHDILKGSESREEVKRLKNIPDFFSAQLPQDATGCRRDYRPIKTQHS
jgi:hypothetical protein